MDDDAGALRRECAGAGGTDATGRAGDEHSFPRESGLHESLRLAAVRVFVVSDMEGVSGIVKSAQTTGGAPMYEEARRLYTEEINAGVRGAKAAGATEIVVMDCHGAGGEWSFNSLVPELLDPDCEFVVQQEWTEYTAFLEQGVDAALFVGMHAMAGTPVIRQHRGVRVAKHAEKPAFMLRESLGGRRLDAVDRVWRDHTEQFTNSRDVQ